MVSLWSGVFVVLTLLVFAVVFGTMLWFFCGLTGILGYDPILGGATLAFFVLLSLIVFAIPANRYL